MIRRPAMAAVAAALLGAFLAGLVLTRLVGGAGDSADGGRAPLDLDLPPGVRAEVGEPVALPVESSDGSSLAVSLVGAPSGARATGASIEWAPEGPGTWPAVVVAVDTRGRAAVQTLRFESRYPHRAEVMLGLGDSVASGHGLQRRDYLGRDDCWRDEADAYPRRVFDGLVDRGALDPERAGFHLVACSAATSADLLTDPVTGGPDDIEGGPRSQVDWAVRANPGVVTLTVGANDLGFVDPARLFGDGGVDWPTVDARLTDLRRHLDEVLGRLVAETDATVVVTGYHDPTAEHPHGVDGCREECFAVAAEEVVDRLNDELRGAAEAAPERVRFTDVAPVFEGHGAPNGYGPDSWRSGGFGVVGRVLNVGGTASIHPFCARGDEPGESWVSAVDCVHPSGAGARAYAELVLDTLG